MTHFSLLMRKYSWILHRTEKNMDRLNLIPQMNIHKTWIKLEDDWIGQKYWGNVNDRRFTRIISPTRGYDWHQWTPAPELRSPWTPGHRTAGYRAQCRGQGTIGILVPVAVKERIFTQETNNGNAKPSSYSCMSLGHHIICSILQQDGHLKRV